MKDASPIDVFFFLIFIIVLFLLVCGYVGLTAKSLLRQSTPATSTESNAGYFDKHAAVGDVLLGLGIVLLPFYVLYNHVL